MTVVRIYCKSKNVAQSGKGGKTGEWVIETERTSSQHPEPLMGWTASGDTLNQLAIRFPNQEKAVAYAKAQGWDYSLSNETKSQVKPRNYGDNFVYKE